MGSSPTRDIWGDFFIPYKNIKKQRKAQHESYLRNKQKYKLRLAERRDSMFVWFSLIKERTGCMCCEETEPSCIEPHHIGEKENSLSRIFRDSLSETKIINELLKCIPLCANCHRKYHLGKSKESDKIREIVDNVVLPYHWKITKYKK